MASSTASTRPTLNSITSCTWVIDQFSTVSTFQTKCFPIVGHEKIICALFLRPVGPQDYMNDCTFLGFSILSSDTDQVKVHYKLSILDKCGAVWLTQVGQVKYNFEIQNEYFTQLNIDRAHLLNRTNGVLTEDDKLTVNCVVYFGDLTNESQCLECGQDKKIFDKYDSFLQSSKHSDVVFVVGGQQFLLHKVILSAGSPVFAAMFDSNLEESKQNCVEIVDVDANVFEQFLRFIYTGKCPSMQKFALDLFVISDKYQVESLKASCEQVLFRSLNNQTVVNILVFADMHQAAELKSECIRFITKNAKQVKTDESWQQLKNKPDLLMQLYDALLEQNSV